MFLNDTFGRIFIFVSSHFIFITIFFVLVICPCHYALNCQNMYRSIKNVVSLLKITIYWRPFWNYNEKVNTGHGDSSNCSCLITLSGFPVCTHHQTMMKIRVHHLPLSQRAQGFLTQCSHKSRVRWFSWSPCWRISNLRDTDALCSVNPERCWT